ncbi:putative ribonuclease H-like domain-containing protein [Tanacetum coccineum]
MDEEFTTTAYPNVQENLKLPTEDQVRLEEPASSAGTLSSLLNLDKELSFADQFLVDKSQEDEPKKTNTESEVHLSTSLHNSSSTTTNININCHGNHNNNISSTTTTSTITKHHIFHLDKAHRLYKLENLDIPHQVSKAVDEIVMDVVDWAIQAPLMDRFRDLPEAESKETRTRTHIAVGKPNPTKLMKITRSSRRKKKMRHESPKTPPGSPPHQPPPPLPPAGPSGTSGSSGASGSFQLPPPPPPPPSTNQSDQSRSTTAPSSSKIVHSSDDEDIGNDHIPKVNLKQDWWKSLSEEDRPATSTAENLLLAHIGDMAIFMDWFCKKQRITELTQKDLEGPAFEIVKFFHPNVIHLQYQMEECHKLLTDQVDDAIIRYGSKGGRPALSILKMKAAGYLMLVWREWYLELSLWIEGRMQWVSNSLVHSLRALSTLRRSGLRTASTAAKPCQGDFSEFYLIAGHHDNIKDLHQLHNLMLAYHDLKKCRACWTGKLDFEDVYFVKELKFNLFSVSQMCDKKNSVLFTETECLVLSPDFKLLDESQVLLKVPRQNNMYSFDLKNVVPSGGLTCLFAKATIDESNLWHRRLGHINFKTMNKLVRGNLVRGLPSKLFENDHSCVACQKGKQHKASCKTKLVSSISHPLQMLHMDLFGPTFVRSINHKIYCLVVTDDYSRFSWVFFLATKDETSGILKTFITGIENQINHKVKIIRCDNGTEFKNNDINQFCGMKGIKREFSVARTP